MPVSRAQNGLRLKKMSAQTKKEETCHQMTTHAIPAMHLNRHRRYVYGLVLRSNVRFCYSNGLTQCECMKDTMLYLDYRLFGDINFHEKLADFHTYHSNFNESSITKQFKNQNLKLFSLFPSIPAGKKSLYDTSKAASLNTFLRSYAYSKNVFMVDTLCTGFLA